MSASTNAHTLPPMAKLYDLMNERGTWHRARSQRMDSFQFSSSHSNQWEKPVPRSSSYSRIQTVTRNSPMIQTTLSGSSSFKPRRVSSFSSISTSGSIHRHGGDHPEEMVECIDPVRCLSNKSSSTVADTSCLEEAAVC